MIHKEVNEYLWRFGYAFAPSVLAIKDLTGGHDGPIDSEGNLVEPPEDFLELEADDAARTEMLRLAQEWRAEEYQQAALEAYGRGTTIDGKPGPATYAMMEMPRCGCPDYAPPRAEGDGAIGAIGSGPWKGCHGVGEFHAAHWQYQNEPPAHMLKDAGDGETVFTKVLRKVRQVNAKKGLLCYYSGPGVIEEFHPKDMKSIQSKVSWTRGAGWIGLAIVGSGRLTCVNEIWVRYDNRWASSYDIENLILGLVLLKLHEQAHNEGLGHTRGGIMNPTLGLRTNPSWEGDVAEKWQRTQFGGVPVPIPGDGDDPKPPPPPDDAPEWVKWLAGIVEWFIKNWPKRKT